MEGERRRKSEIRGYQPTYISVLNNAVEQASSLMLKAGSNPFTAHKYARALENLIILLPPVVRERVRDQIAGKYRVLATVKPENLVAVIKEWTLRKCERDQYSHPYANASRCLSLLSRVLDELFAIVMAVAHEEGLFLQMRSYVVSGEEDSGDRGEYVGEVEW